MIRIILFLEAVENRVRQESLSVCQASLKDPCHTAFTSACRNYIQEFMSFPDSTGFLLAPVLVVFRQEHSFLPSARRFQITIIFPHLNHAFRQVQQALDTFIASSYIFHHLSLTFGTFEGHKLTFIQTYPQRLVS